MRISDWSSDVCSSDLKDHGMIHGVKFLERFLALLVAPIGAVEDTAAGGAAAEAVERVLARGDDVVVEGHAHVVIGTEQDRLAPVADRDGGREHFFHHQAERVGDPGCEQVRALLDQRVEFGEEVGHIKCPKSVRIERSRDAPRPCAVLMGVRSEEHTSELQSLMRSSYAVFCLKKKTKQQDNTQNL